MKHILYLRKYGTKSIVLSLLLSCRGFDSMFTEKANDAFKAGTTVQLAKAGGGKVLGTMVDVNGDGIPEGIDLNGDGIPEILFRNLVLGQSAGLDLNGDGASEYYLSVDYQGNFYISTTNPGGNSTSGNVAVTTDTSGTPTGFNATGGTTVENNTLSQIYNDSNPPTTNTNSGGTFAGAQTVNLTCSDNIACNGIAYTTDGSTPSFSGNGTVVTSSSTQVTIGSTATLKWIVRDSKGNVSAPQSASFTITGSGDSTPPAVASSTPTNAATNVAPCTGSPCRGKIQIVFTESMDTGLTQTLTTEIFNGSAYVNAPNTGTTFIWTTTTLANDTLTMNISWYWFPENSQIRYTLAASGLRDLAGNQITAQIQRSFTTTTVMQAFPVADDGQTICWNNTTSQACGNPSFPGQDGDYANTPVARSFTGPTQHGTYTSDYTTTDNLTSIVWKACTEGLSNASCSADAATGMTWYSAVNQCATLNSANSGSGYANKVTWRLATLAEMKTLPNLGASPAINGTSFPATQTTQNYWTATARISSLSDAWSWDFNNGPPSSNTKSSNLPFVRCIASPGTINAISLTDNGDGTVTNTRTNLRWQKCSRGQNNDASCSGTATTASWATALTYCDSLTLGSFGNSSNWRLPSFAELASLYDEAKSNPPIDATYFPATQTNDYWSSTTYAASGASTWNVSFSTFFSSSGAKTNSTNFYTRCVATGP